MGEGIALADDVAKTFCYLAPQTEHKSEHTGICVSQSRPKFCGLQSIVPGDR